jgi:hypothetical protein
MADGVRGATADGGLKTPANVCGPQPRYLLRIDRFSLVFGRRAKECRGDCARSLGGYFLTVAGLPSWT